MRGVSGVQHQAILQASDTSEAEFLTLLWNAHPENRSGPALSIAAIHSEMAREQVQEVVQRLKTHQLDAIIHVGMIGEGFDHPHLSLCVIFRRFASMPPVVQLLGRVLRRISGADDADNNAFIIAHPALGFAKHWKVYKQEDRLPDDSQLSCGAGSTRWTDIEETYSYDETHADWFA